MHESLGKSQQVTYFANTEPIPLGVVFFVGSVHKADVRAFFVDSRVRLTFQRDLVDSARARTSAANSPDWRLLHCSTLCRQRRLGGSWFSLLCCSRCISWLFCGNGFLCRSLCWLSLFLWWASSLPRRGTCSYSLLRLLCWAFRVDSFLGGGVNFDASSRHRSWWGLARWFGGFFYLLWFWHISFVF